MSKLATAAFIRVSGRKVARTISYWPVPWRFLNKRHVLDASFC